MRPWFKLKANLSYRDWSRAVDRNSLKDIRTWLYNAEQQIAK